MIIWELKCGRWIIPYHFSSALRQRAVKYIEELLGLFYLGSLTLAKYLSDLLDTTHMVV